MRIKAELYKIIHTSLMTIHKIKYIGKSVVKNGNSIYKHGVMFKCGVLILTCNYLTTTLYI